MSWDQVPSSAEVGQEEMFLVLAQLVATLGEFVFTPNSWLFSLLGGKENQGPISKRKGFNLSNSPFQSHAVILQWWCVYRTCLPETQAEVFC